MDSTYKKRVAIIGAGLNGLSILRRLSENKNFQFTCFEKNYALGGIWVYTDQTDEDIYGRPINTAVYNYLRTNIPRQLMELEGFPLDDHQSFPDHRQILQYLNKVADTCGLRQYIKFNTVIRTVRPKSPSVRNTKWLVTYGDSRVVCADNGKTSEDHTEEFDNVIVCTGNCTTTNSPVIEGEKDFQGLIVHSRQYRHPELFAGQNVAVLGAHYSGIDISFDLSKHAKKVYLCHRNAKLETIFPDNIIQKTSGFKRFTSSTVILENAEEFPVDTVIYCTGFKYNFPFLPDGMFQIGENNLVNNLYKYIIPVKYSSLYVMGILREVAFFPMSDHQALFIQAAMEGKAKLPTQDEMVKIVADESTRTICGSNQWQWDRELAKIAGNFEPYPVVLQKIWDSHFDVWAQDFRKCRSLKYEKVNQDCFKLV